MVIDKNGREIVKGCPIRIDWLSGLITEGIVVRVGEDGFSADLEFPGWKTRRNHGPGHGKTRRFQDVGWGEYQTGTIEENIVDVYVEEGGVV